MGQELLIDCVVGLPVNAVHLRVIELVLYLLPDMVEQIAALLVGAVVEGRLEIDAYGIVLAEVDLLDAPVAEVEVLEVLVGQQLT